MGVPPVCVWAHSCPHRLRALCAAVDHSRRRLAGVRLSDIPFGIGLQRGHQRMEHRVGGKHVPGMRHFGPARALRRTRSAGVVWRQRLRCCARVGGYMWGFSTNNYTFAQKLQVFPRMYMDARNKINQLNSGRINPKCVGPSGIGQRGSGLRKKPRFYTKL
jgi:hypothetical protein